MNLVQVDRPKHLGSVADKAGRGIINLHPRDRTDVEGGEVAHQHTTEGPIDHIDPGQVPRPHRHVSPSAVARLIELRERLGVVAKVGIHLQDVVVVVLESPLEAGNVGCPQSLFTAAAEQEDPTRLLLRNLGNLGTGAVGRSIVHDEDVEGGIAQLQYRSRDGADILYLIIGRYDDQLTSHSLFSLSV